MAIVGQNYIDHRVICDFTSVAAIRLTIGYFTRVLHLCQTGEGCRARMTSTYGSRLIHDRHTQPSCDSVGLPFGGSKCRDDACLLGSFDYPSISMIHISTGDGRSGTKMGSSVVAGTSTSLGVAQDQPQT